MDKKSLHLIHQIRKRVKNRNKICVNKNCTRPAIMSHLLQENGILNFIATNNNIIQLNSDRNFNDTNYRFQKRSIGKAEVLIYKGFCAICDNKMFESIEKSIPNFSEYQTQLLFSYRAFLREYSAIKYGLDFYSELIACEELNPEIKARLAPMKKRYELVLFSYDYFLQLFNIDLKRRYNSLYASFLGLKKHFKFHRFEVPKIEIAASAIFSYPQDVDFKRDQYNLKKVVDKKTASSIKPIFINIIPRENSSVIIIGYPKGNTRIEHKPVNRIDEMSPKELYKLISDILIKRIDNWCTSVSFFEKMQKSGKDKRVIDLKHEYLVHPLSEMNLIKEMELDFDLFQDF